MSNAQQQQQSQKSKLNKRILDYIQSIEQNSNHEQYESSQLMLHAYPFKVKFHQKQIYHCQQCTKNQCFRGVKKDNPHVHYEIEQNQKRYWICSNQAKEKYLKEMRSFQKLLYRRSFKTIKNQHETIQQGYQQPDSLGDMEPNLRSKSKNCKEQQKLSQKNYSKQQNQNQHQAGELNSEQQFNVRAISQRSSKFSIKKDKIQHKALNQQITDYNKIDKKKNLSQTSHLDKMRKRQPINNTFQHNKNKNIFQNKEKILPNIQIVRAIDISNELFYVYKYNNTVYIQQKRTFVFKYPLQVIQFYENQEVNKKAALKDHIYVIM